MQVFPMVAGSLVLLLGLPLAAQTGIGARYGARDPHCGSRKTAGKGAPPLETVRESLSCAYESVFGGMLYLIDNVRVEFAGNGRPYNPGADPMRDIDASAPVYPIRGSLSRYQCREVRVAGVGRNCYLYDENPAFGQCYKNTAGDWICSMSGAQGLQKKDMPPPSGR